MADGTRTHDSRNHNPGLYQLSYGHHNYAMRDGAPGRARTCDPRLRRRVLYPTELRALASRSDREVEGMKFGVADGNRTRDTRSHNPVLYQLSYSHH